MRRELYIAVPGRLDDMGQDGTLLVDSRSAFIANYDYPAQVCGVGALADASAACGESGRHVATLPFNVIKQILQHPLTDAGLEKFLADWHKTKQKI